MNIERRSGISEDQVIRCPSTSNCQPPTVNCQLSLGFTLLEVMVSVAMLGVFLIPLMITHGDTIRNIRAARELTRASFLAQSRIGMLETLGFEGLEMAGEDEAMEEYPYLKMTDEVTYDEEGVLALALVQVFPRSSKPGKTKDEKKRVGVDLETYIVNLYFEKEEEAEIVEE